MIVRLAQLFALTASAGWCITASTLSTTASAYPPATRLRGKPSKGRDSLIFWREYE